MQHIRTSILKHVRVNMFLGNEKLQIGVARHMCSPPKLSDRNQVMARVIGLVKKYDKIDANKVTATADFQKDLCLDSLDRVELVMAIEQEFSIEIPDEKADKLSCCDDVINYVLSETKHENA